MLPDRTGAETTEPRLVLLGSVIVDLVLPVRALPARGGDMIAVDAAFCVGGGWYVLSAAAGAGLHSAYAGRHGQGPMGERVRAALDGIGVEMMLAPDRSGDTGMCVTLVEPDGERTFITHPGVEARLDSATLAGLVVVGTDIVYVSGYDLAYADSGPAILRWLERRPGRAALVVDPGPLVADIPAAVLSGALRRTTLLTLSQVEGHLLSGERDPVLVIAAVRDRLAPQALVVVRDGERGADVSGGALGDRLLHVPAMAVRVVDTTGAGDTHTGALVAALAAGVEPVAAVQRANAAAARLVGRARPYRTVGATI